MNQWPLRNISLGLCMDRVLSSKSKNAVAQIQALQPSRVAGKLLACPLIQLSSGNIAAMFQLVSGPETS